MDSEKIKNEINQLLEKADDRVLIMVHGLLKADQASSGEVDSDYKQKLIDRARKSEKDINERRVKTSKQIREQIKKW